MEYCENYRYSLQRQFFNKSEKEMIKWIAFITMVIDHVGLIFFPNLMFLRYIGRVSMPLYAYCLARGFKSSNEKGTLGKYFLKIIIFTVLSEIPYHLVIDDGFNIGVTWVLALVFMICARHMRQEGFFVGLFSLLGCFLACNIINPMYGWYGMVLPYYFLINMDDNYNVTWAPMFIEMFLITFLYGNVNQYLALISIPVLWFILPLEKDVKFPNWLNHLAYPCHILLLGFIELLF